ncbi:MAG TPA: ATP-binding cassette domain-containing protein, partial [Acidimicrobiia bacterium]|nr:ATP-binding cassette domain-containing protein [Acidimicrobiia bacterium]
MTETTEHEAGRAVLRLDGANKTYRQGPVEVVALAPTDLTITIGQFVAVMGPSGSGKSTLLLLLGSLLDPTSGDVLIDGARVGALSVPDRARLRRRSVGFVFQELNLIPGLTALENVTLPRELDGVSFGKARREALE